jgi:hypothetical protein
MITILSFEYAWYCVKIDLTIKAKLIWQKILFANISFTLVIGSIFSKLPFLQFRLLSLLAVLILLCHLFIAKQRKVRFDDDYKFSGNFFFNFLAVDLPLLYLVLFSILQFMLI